MGKKIMGEIFEKNPMALRQFNPSILFQKIHPQSMALDDRETRTQNKNNIDKPYLQDHPMTCKWLKTMVSKSPNWGYSPSKWPVMAYK